MVYRPQSRVGAVFLFVVEKISSIGFHFTEKVVYLQSSIADASLMMQFKEDSLSAGWRYVICG